MTASLEIRVTNVRYWTSKPRKKPKAGDRRVTKKHGLQIRVHQRSNGCLVMGGGHRYYLYEWCKPEDLSDWDKRLYLKPGDLPTPKQDSSDIESQGPIHGRT